MAKTSDFCTDHTHSWWRLNKQTMNEQVKQMAVSGCVKSERWISQNNIGKMLLCENGKSDSSGNSNFVSIYNLLRNILIGFTCQWDLSNKFDRERKQLSEWHLVMPLKLVVWIPRPLVSAFVAERVYSMHFPSISIERVGWSIQFYQKATEQCVLSSGENLSKMINAWEK